MNMLITRREIYQRSLRHFFAPVAKVLYEDESVTEVLINGPDNIYVERSGKLQKIDARFPSEEVLLAAVNNLAEYVDRRVDDLHHSMDARLPEPEQFRVHVIIPPCSRNGVVVSIRKFRRASHTLKSLVDLGSMTEAARQFLVTSVKLHRNLVVSGGTGTGKTSLLNAISEAIDPTERIVVIEDSSELRLQQPHTVYLEARAPLPNGTGGVTIRNLFVDSLRMRPDRIVVGEVRRGEALDLIQSMLSGHDGSLTTVHASSPKLALVRLETLCLMSDVQLPAYVARTQVASAIHVVVQITRAHTGRRHVTSIAEVRGLDQKERYRVRELFRLSTDGVTEGREATPTLVPTGRPCSYARLAHVYGYAAEAPLCAELFALRTRDR
ncbi:CpaF family protein [Planctomyces sp. SH-PL14]|uniref:CpaF family protein n=1 Tax=Planctomyces sp. SH-PL14 TaxID=1632864 RepID=UPI00078BA049|nr:ATPase, T2SS/T4P/T4SS family [Planctomyces sp. SH-PL14]AMV22518.1 Putative conjugal transfer protein [Planctomyces sp. SH-PL14]